jgi:hypothetical protein
MKKVTLFVALLVIAISSIVYAQAVATNPTVNSTTGDTVLTSGNPPNKSVNYQGLDVASIGAWGTNTTGASGYIVLKGCINSGANCYPYYLWVDKNGYLEIASYATIAAFTSFPSGSWADLPAIQKVGAQ